MPEAYPYAYFMYGHRSRIVYHEGDNYEVIVNDLGIVQGNAMSGLFYGLAARDALIEFAEAHPPILDLSYYDDISLRGPILEVLPAIDHLAHLLEPSGIRLKRGPNGKCFLYSKFPFPVELDIETRIQEAGLLIRDGIVQVGTPVGTPDFINSFLQERVNFIINGDRQLLELVNGPTVNPNATTQAGILVVRMCGAYSQFNHLTRTLDPEITIPHANRLDDHTVQITLELVNLEERARKLGILDSVRKRLFLRGVDGGLSMISSTLMATGAFVGSWALCGPVIREMLPDCSFDSLLPGLASLRGAIDDLQQRFPGKLPTLSVESLWNAPSQQRRMQKTFKKLVDAKQLISCDNDLPIELPPEAFSRELAHQSLQASERRLCALGKTNNASANAWVYAVPNAPQKKMDRDTMRTMVGIQLGIPIIEPGRVCSQCDCPIDEFGAHAIYCSRNGSKNAGAIFSHNTLRDAILKQAKFMLGDSVSTTSEPRMVLSGHIGRRNDETTNHVRADGIIRSNVPDTNDVLFDVAKTHPNTKQYLGKYKKPGDAADLIEAEKSRHYNSFFSQINTLDKPSDDPTLPITFYVGIESYGAIGKGGKKLIDHLCTSPGCTSPDPVKVWNFHTAISCALAKARAVQLKMSLYTFVSPPEVSQASDIFGTMPLRSPNSGYPRAAGGKKQRSGSRRSSLPSSSSSSSSSDSSIPRTSMSQQNSLYSTQLHTRLNAFSVDINNGAADSPVPLQSSSPLSDNQASQFGSNPATLVADQQAFPLPQDPPSPSSFQVPPLTTATSPSSSLPPPANFIQQ